MRFARTLTAGIVAVALVSLAPAMSARASQAITAETLLGEALHLEEVQSNFAGAIAIYQRVVGDAKAPRTVVARALLQMGGCYERLGRPEARATYERVIAQHGDSGPIVAAAKDRLEAMQAASAGPRERVLTTDPYFGGIGARRFSPDGRMVIGMPLGSELDGGGLYIKSTETTAGRLVFGRRPGFAPGFWGFSPDSRRFAALMPEMPPQSVIAGTIQGKGDLAALFTPGVLVIGAVDGRNAPAVIEIPQMAAVNPFQPFTNPLAWSPDSQWLAVAFPGSPLHTYEIQVINVVTNERRPLGFKTQGSIDLHWSSSGRDLLVHVAATASTPGELRVINAATAATRTLPLPGAPGARLRVVRWNANGEIAIRHLDPATPQREDTFLVAADTGVSRKTCTGQAVNLAGTGGVPSATGDLCREITRDGARQVVWRHASKQLMVRDLVTGADKPLTTSSGEEYFGILSPDDRVVAFVSNRTGRWGLYAADIARAPVPNPRQLTEFDDMPGSFDLGTWTPDGLIASVSRRESNILRMKVDAATGVAAGYDRLTQDGIRNHTPAVSPDGKRIVYWSQHGSRFGLAVMDADGANERLLAETLQDYPGLRPSWRSPSEVIFTAPPAGSSPTMPVAPVPGTPRTLMSLNVITGVVAPIAELSGVPPLEGRPQYLAGTGEILHLDSDFRTIRSQSLATGTSRVVATFPGEAEVDAFLASPDGAKIAFVLAERYASGRACMARPTGSVTAVDAIARLCEIRLLTLATGEQQVLATRGGQGASVPALVDWSPDGRFLLFADGRPQILDTVSGEVKPLLAPNVRLDWDRTASWSPDGTFIVLPTRSTRFEWRQWTGVR